MTSAFIETEFYRLKLTKKGLRGKFKFSEIMQFLSDFCFEKKVFVNDNNENIN